MSFGGTTQSSSGRVCYLGKNSLRFTDKHNNPAGHYLIVVIRVAIWRHIVHVVSCLIIQFVLIPPPLHIYTRIRFGNIIRNRWMCWGICRNHVVLHHHHTTTHPRPPCHADWLGEGGERTSVCWLTCVIDAANIVHTTSVEVVFHQHNVTYRPIETT